MMPHCGGSQWVKTIQLGVDRLAQQQSNSNCEVALKKSKKQVLRWDATKHAAEASDPELQRRAHEVAVEFKDAQPPSEFGSGDFVHVVSRRLKVEAMKLFPDFNPDTKVHMIVAAIPIMEADELAACFPDLGPVLAAYYQRLNEKIEAQKRQQEALKREQEVMEAARQTPSQSNGVPAKPDLSDVVAQVLNYSNFGNDGGSRILGVFWHRVDECRYKLSGSPSLNVSVSEIDLNAIDPNSITFQYQPGEVYPNPADVRQLRQGPGGIIIFADTQPLLIGPESLNIERLQRGWGLIYSKYCKGTKRAF